MAFNEAELDRIVKSLSDSLSKINNDLSRFSAIQTRVTSELENVSSRGLKNIQDMLVDSESKLKDVIEKEIEARESRTNDINQKLKDITNEEILLRREASKHESIEINKHVEERVVQLAQEREQYEVMLEIQRLYNEGKAEEARQLEQAYNVRKEINAALETENQRHISELGKQNREIESGITKFATITVKSLTQQIESGVNSVTTVYEQHASKLSVALDTTVQGISDLQNKIASNLRDEGLSRAISNVQVLTEAATLTSAGYTNIENIQQSATDIAIGRQLAPNLDFSNTTVRNLTNVFGSDFTNKFTAIQQATQETAGSVVSMEATISSMMSGLEPVFTNAELQSAALQGASNVSATLSAAREQNLITETQEKEYLSMINELMDPSKAFTSSNTAVKVAAQSFYAQGELTPDAALSALLSATQSMYSTVGQSMSANDVIARSLFANAMGMNSMQAAYMPSGYTSVGMTTTGDLGATYQEQLENLQSGRYTTRAQQEQNIISNAAIVQTLGNFAKEYPILYKTTSAQMFTLVNSLPERFARAVSMRGTSIGGRRIGGGGGISDEIEDVFSDSRSYLTQNLSDSNVLVGMGLLSNQLSSGFRGTHSLLNSRAMRANLSSGAALGVGMWGLTSAGSIATDIFDPSKETWAQRLGSGGDVGSSMANWAGVGASAGMLLGTVIPGLGNAVGTAIGAAVGGAGGLIAAISAQREATEAQTKATEEQNKMMDETLGKGVTYKSTLEAQSELAAGGGTVSLAGGKTAAIDTEWYSHATGLDYVPYDNYVARLHKGEAVVTANAASSLRKSNPNFWNMPSNNGDVVDALERQTQSIVEAVNGEDEIKPLARNTGPKQYTITNVYA